MIILGLDEVGRGCWAGPLVAGAAILAQPIPGLADSKQLSSRRRAELSAIILSEARAIGLGWVQPAEIDAIGLTAAVKLAMQRALEKITIDYDELVIDGNYNFFPDNVKARPVVKADTIIPAVSAASIIAKVARDNYMRRAASQYPDYGFDKHVGYGTALHLERLTKYGASKLHRQSFKPIQVLMSS